MNGIINVLKPPGITSHDVVDIVRRLTGVKKVGHTGTLDPGAAGVLPLCVGKATRVARFFVESNKSYRGELILGFTTDSQDIFGKILRVIDASCITKEDFLKEMESFRGRIEQTPPMYSAVRVRGKRLYESARAGRKVQRRPRPAYIYSLEHIRSIGWGTGHPTVFLEVKCSKGTYIRTLFSDIGNRLQCGAVMSFLLRTGVGGFDINDSWTIEELTDACRYEKLDRVVLDMNEALSFLPCILVKTSAIKPVSSGSPLYPPGVEFAPKGLNEGDLVRLCGNNKLLALARVKFDKRNGKQRLIYIAECVLS